MINILVGVPQRFILGPLLFNIFLYDLFFPVANYGDSILYWFKNFNVLINLENAAETLLQWFKDNSKSIIYS